MSLLIYADERVAEHRPPAGHPERPERYGAAVAGIEAAGFGEALQWRTPTEAPIEALVGVHDQTLVNRIVQLGEAGGARIDPDTHMSAGSLVAARLAAGAGLDAIDALRSSQADLESIESWAKTENLTWRDVEHLISESISQDEKLKQLNPQDSTRPGELTLEELDEKRKAGSARLEKLELLYSAGGLSQSQIEDRRLKQQLLEEEYELRRRRKLL